MKYRGYDIVVEFESGVWLIYKGKRLVHKASSNVAATKWVDKKLGAHK